MTNKFNKYLKTYAGDALLKEHSLDEIGVWEVRGEDPNCDFGGTHHEPFIGLFAGTLRDIIGYAVEHPSFWQWGTGGSIKPAPKVQKIDANSLTNRREIETDIAAKKAELAALEARLKVT